MHFFGKAKKTVLLVMGLVILSGSACSGFLEAPPPQIVEVTRVVAVTQIVQVTPVEKTSPVVPDPLVWYDFDDDFPASGIILDRSGNRYDARVVGSVGTTKGILGGQAISFSGNGTIQAKTNPAAGKKDVSFSLWFKTSRPEANYKFASATWWSGGPGSGWVLATHIPEFWSDNTHSLFLPNLPNQENAFPANEWEHEVVTYDGVDIREYTNGHLVNDWPSTGAAMGQGRPMVLGGWPDAGFFYEGAIDEFQIFDRTLTKEEVLALYTQTRMVNHQITPAAPAETMFFPPECLTRKPGMDYGRYDSFNLNTVGACSFVKPSPGGKFVAYATITCNPAGECGEGVKLLKGGAREAPMVDFMAKAQKRWVGELGWSPGGDLFVTWNDINQGNATDVFSVPDDPQAVRRLARVPGGIANWNAARSTFVTNYGGGPGSCNNTVSGFDFTSNRMFPDIAAALRLVDTRMQIYRGPAGAVQDWRDGDASVLVLVTPLEEDKQRKDYRLLPSIAGKITLTGSGPVFTTLGIGDNLDFYFAENASGYTVESKPYKLKYCKDTVQ